MEIFILELGELRFDLLDRLNTFIIRETALITYTFVLYKTIVLFFFGLNITDCFYMDGVVLELRILYLLPFLLIYSFLHHYLSFDLVQLLLPLSYAFLQFLLV